MIRINQAFGWSVSGLSVMAVFGVLYFAADRFLWKRKWIRQILLVPDLNGTWVCTGKTCFKDGQQVQFDWQGTVVICQSWSRIIVRLKTKQSESQSIGASLTREAGMGYRLIYHYDNAPAIAEAVLKRHSGLCDLIFDENAASAEGQYFTDKDRMTAGTMQLQRKGSPDEPSGKA